VWSPCLFVCLVVSSFGGERSLVHQGGEFGMVWYGMVWYGIPCARWMVASSWARGIGISPGPVAARILGLSCVWQLSWKRVARQSEGDDNRCGEFLEVYKCAV